MARKFRNVLLDLLKGKSGNVAMTFALISVPMIIGVGTAVDYARQYNVQSKLQTDLDASLLAAVRQVSNLDETAIKQKISNWIASQKEGNDASYDFKAEDVVVSKADNTITATARATLPTTLLGIANIKTLAVKVNSSVVGPSTSYMNVYIVLDKSASMLLAATSSGQNTMRYSAAGCVFACHTAEGGPWTYNNKSYSTNYKLAKAMGVTLRADVSVTAAKEVLTLVSAADPTQSRIKVGLYTIGANLTEVVAPTTSMTTAKTALDNDAKGLNSATSEVTSRFDTTLPSLTSLVGTAGDGKTATTPLKLVLLLTDGVMSERNWVLNGVWWDSNGKMRDGADWYKVAPFNPSWCTAMKNNKATVGVLYTEYLDTSWDEGYVHTVGETMKSANWTSTWGGVMRTNIPNTTTRQAYIPYAMQDCATSSDMFLGAANQAAIEKGLSQLFQAYVGSVRVTN